MKKIITIYLLSSFFLLNAFGESRNYTIQEKELIIDLFDSGALQFNTLNLDDQVSLPYYINLSAITSFPKLNQQIVQLLSEKTKHLLFDTICGVPTALSLSSNIAYELGKPLIMCKQVKNYGKKIEGVFVPFSRCLVVEESMCTGESLMATIKELQDANLGVYDCLVFCDSQQGAVELLQKRGYNIRVLFTIADFLNVLIEAERVEPDTAQDILAWSENHQIA